jgi:hypothetical protein
LLRIAFTLPADAAAEAIDALVPLLPRGVHQRELPDGSTEVSFYEHAADLPPREFLLAFRGGVGSAHPTPDPLPEELLRGVRLLQRERPPWEADPPLQRLREASFPKLVISGGHSLVFEAVCDAVAERIGAQREVIPGRGHTIPATGEPYNACLAAFLKA